MRKNENEKERERDREKEKLHFALFQDANLCTILSNVRFGRERETDSHNAITPTVTVCKLKKRGKANDAVE